MNDRTPDSTPLPPANPRRRQIMLCVGLLQGILLWALITARQDKIWPATDPIALWTLLHVVLTLPLAWYLTEAIDGLSARRRAVIVAALGLGMALLGAYDMWVQADKDADSFPRFSHLLGCAVLGFAAIPLMSHAQRATGRGWSWRYPALFQTAWRNAVMVAVAAALTGVFWIVLWAGASMMAGIGLPFMTKLIAKPAFALPVTTLMAAIAFDLALTRADLIVSLRRFWLSMNQIFLPLLLLFAVMWVIALPFTGLDALLKTRHTALVLLWFTALAVNFANTARQDGLSAPPFTPMLRRVLAIAWLTLPVVVAIGAWAMYQRIAQHGWTQDRVWGVFALALAACYALGYAASVRQGQRGWMWSIDRSNIATALLMCLGLVALLTPLADARRIAVASQVDRLERGAVAADDFDYAYLARQTGRYGHAALQRLADGTGHPQNAQIAAAARDALADKDNASAARQVLSDAEASASWRMLPEGAAADPAEVEAVLAWLHIKEHEREEQTCLRARNHCALWPVDLDGDGTREIVLISGNEAWSQALVLGAESKTGALRLEGLIVNVDKKWVDEIAQHRAVLKPPRWQEIEADGRLVRIEPAGEQR